VTRILFRGGAVFDAAAAATSLADVVVEDSRIVAVGPGLDGDEEVDVTGRTLLPGLFDCHVHVVLTEPDLLRSAAQPFSYQFFQAVRNLRATLDLGITTARDAWGADLGVKRAVSDGLVAGPRLQISIAMLSQTGGHGDAWMPCGSELSMFGAVHPGRPSGIVDGPEEMRRKVRELIRAGADVLKVATSGGVLSPQSDPRHGHFSAAELDVLAAEARAAGRYVMAHAQAAEGIKAAVRAGVRSVEHGIFLDDEAIDLMLEHGTWLVPTLLAPHGLLAAVDSGAAVPAASIRKAHEVLAAHTDSFARAVDAGVRVAMGTDCPVSPHGTNLRELELMTSLSAMTPAAALVSATASAAQLLGVGDELGSLEPGKRADLVVVGGDPYDFAKLAERVEQVWQDGVRVSASPSPLH
jgi:imidazolonepropionase-like amidohydrolase